MSPLSSRLRSPSPVTDGSMSSNGSGPEYSTSTVSQSSSSDSEQDSQNEDESSVPENFTSLAKPLYEGSKITVATAVFAVMEFCINNHLSYKAMDDLLKLLQLLCISPNRLPGSVYLFKKIFKQFKGEEYNSTKVCCQCKEKVDEQCSCETPKIGTLISVPIEKAVQAIVTSK